MQGRGRIKRQGMIEIGQDHGIDRLMVGDKQ
jgi:hypothetical protein